MVKNKETYSKSNLSAAENENCFHFSVEFSAVRISNLFILQLRYQKMASQIFFHVFL